MIGVVGLKEILRQPGTDLRTGERMGNGCTHLLRHGNDLSGDDAHAVPPVFNAEARERSLAGTERSAQSTAAAGAEGVPAHV